MTEKPDEVRRTLRPPEEGWALGAGGLPAAVWGALGLALLGLAVLLFALGYLGYGVMMAVLAAAAAVNTW